MKHKQTGLSLIGTLIIGAILVFFFLLGMQTVPAITEYMAVKRVLNAIVEESSAETTAADVRRDFDKRAYIDDVKTVSGKDLNVVKRSGRLDVSVAYERKIPIVANASLLLEFQASADK